MTTFLGAQRENSDLRFRIKQLEAELAAARAEYFDMARMAEKWAIEAMHMEPVVAAAFSLRGGYTDLNTPDWDESLRAFIAAVDKYRAAQEES